MYHTLVQKDLDNAWLYYESASDALGGQFFAELLSVIASMQFNPQHSPPTAQVRAAGVTQTQMPLLRQGHGTAAHHPPATTGMADTARPRPAACAPDHHPPKQSMTTPPPRVNSASSGVGHAMSLKDVSASQRASKVRSVRQQATPTQNGALHKPLRELRGTVKRSEQQRQSHTAPKAKRKGPTAPAQCDGRSTTGLSNNCVPLKSGEDTPDLIHTP